MTGDRPALTLNTNDGFEFRSRVVYPHDGMGGHAQVTVDYWQRVDDEGYLAVMPLDGSRARVQDGDDSLRLPPGIARSAVGWSGWFRPRDEPEGVR